MPDLGALYASHPVWIWIALGAAVLAIEVATGSGWLLWPAASAWIVAAAVAFAGLDLSQAALVFALLTISLALLARRYLPKSLFHHAGQHDINDNIGRLVGHQGRVVAAFKGRSGRVFIDGKEWAAETDAGEALEAGAQVEVTGVAGAHLRVRSA
jgi:membrane protein implicated in regulation of membrane protease activity